MNFQVVGAALLLLIMQLNGSMADNLTATDTENLPGECEGRVVCPAVIKVRWNEPLCREPHLIKHENGTKITYDGIFPLILEQMLTVCCGICWEIEYLDSNDFLDPTGSDLFVPVILNYKESGLSSQTNVVPILPHTGVAFVVITEEKKNLPVKILSSIVSSWPVLVLTLVLSVTAGIVAWALDTRQNTQEFPMTFIQGSWEGFWWAFVSMTTVGYGDRCPRSIPGRLFAVVWILVGICMCSIFTAMLTTSLTTISLDTAVTLPGSKVAALMSSIEATTGFQHQADVIRVFTVEEIREKMVKGEAVGGLMDSFTITHYQKWFPDSRFKVQEVISQDYLEYGARVSSSSLASCMKNIRFSEESELYELAELYMGRPMKSGVGESVERSNSLFDPDGLLFYPALFMCLGIIAFLLLAGLTWEICRRAVMCRRPKEERRDDEISVCNKDALQRRREMKALLEEFEGKIVEDVKQIVKALRKTLVNLNQLDSGVDNDENGPDSLTTI